MAPKKQYRRRRVDSDSDSDEEHEEGQVEEPLKKHRQDSAGRRSRDRPRNGSSRRRDRECCFNIESDTVFGGPNR